jgi:hypothetical protein
MALCRDELGDADHHRASADRRDAEGRLPFDDRRDTS